MQPLFGFLFHLIKGRFFTRMWYSEIYISPMYTEGSSDDRVPGTDMHKNVIHKCCCTIRIIICLIYKFFLPLTITVPNFQRWHAKMLKAKLDQVEELSQSCWELIGKLTLSRPPPRFARRRSCLPRFYFFIYIHWLWKMHFNMTMSHWQKH